MATKKTTKKTASRAPEKREATSGSDGNSRIKVRMYRQGLGDCFLITLPRKNGKPYYLMIDCGVILGTPDAAQKMQNVLESIVATTSGHIDLLIVTHEHWDHLSGFIQARDLFAKLKVDKVWFAWTEDPNDELARKLRAEHQASRMALASACARLHLGAGGDSTIDGFLELFGAAGQGTTGDALKIVRGLCEDIRFCRPADAPVDVVGADARLFILGPPPDENMIKRFNPSKIHPETYGLAAMNVNKLASATSEGDLSAPFDLITQIPFDAARQMPFFQTHYWGEDPDARKQEAAGSTEKSGFETHTESDQSWRRIDGDWLDISSGLALQLDSATNNTSLVLAIELGNGKVLLFAGDAQVGNWLSWQDLSWTVGGKTVTGPDLLGRTVLYKAGHHGSHNATLQEKGLEMMTNLEIALIPVDHEMAIKKRWGNIPLGQLEQRLGEITKDRVLRIDKDLPSALAGSVEQDEARSLYYEVTL
jgi:beta-lactamase superfamily II metal-dependent hydrolase